tara:strand:- start:19643 stop:20350 length:708 start_codon:yes stop_codon:yes gene_type:complete
MRSCYFPHAKQTYIEIERYRADYEGDAAWMNLTFIGVPDITVSLGMNQVWIPGSHFMMPTLTRLESSLWLRVDERDDNLVVEFAPLSSSHFGQILSAKHESSGQVRITASTEKGMEQVLRNVTGELPMSSQPVKRKTVHEIERRIVSLEKKLRMLLLENEQTHDKHERMRMKMAHDMSVKISDIDEFRENSVSDVESIRWSISKWGFIVILVALVVLFVSWREYQRHKKSSRWML